MVLALTLPAPAGAVALIDENCPADTAVVSEAELRSVLAEVSSLTGMAWDGSTFSILYMPLQRIRAIPGRPDALARYDLGMAAYRCLSWTDWGVVAHEACHHLQWINGAPYEEAPCEAVQALDWSRGPAAD